MTQPTVKFQAFGQSIIVKPDEAPKPKKGEIIAPETSKKELSTGVVVNTGPMVGAQCAEACSRSTLLVIAEMINGLRSQGLVPQVGDRVKFLAHCGADVKVDGVEYKILHENEVKGKFL